MTRKFTNFTIETSFPENTEVTLQNFYKHGFVIRDNNGKLLSIMQPNSLTMKGTDTMINGSETFVKETIHNYIENEIYWLRQLRTVL